MADDTNQFSQETSIESPLKGIEAQPSKISAQLKKKLLENPEGTKCECCGTVLKADIIELGAWECLWLMDILKWYRHAEHQPDLLDYFTIDKLFSRETIDLRWLHVDFFVVMKRLMAFDLIENKGTIDDKGTFVLDPGYYRISANGVKFAQREVAIVVKAITYQDEILGHKTNPYYTITEILEMQTPQLNYDALMSPQFVINPKVGHSRQPRMDSFEKNTPNNARPKKI